MESTRVQSIPTELLLLIFMFLELRPYIISHRVCTEWRRLLPLTELHPIRRRLYDLYRLIIQTPHFQRALGWRVQNLYPFDRQEYIDALLAQYPVIPEEFRMWILEWPARLAIRCIWPGLPFVECRSVSLMRRNGVNWLGYHSSSPKLRAVVFNYRTRDTKFIPALLIWRENTATDWLVFDKDEPSIFGKVYSSNFLSNFPHSATIPSSVVDKSSYVGEEADSDMNSSREFPDWISYQEFHWRITSVDLTRPQYRRRANSMTHPDIGIGEPVRMVFDRMGSRALPAPAWSDRGAFTDRLRFS